MESRIDVWGDRAIGHMRKRKKEANVRGQAGRRKRTGE